MLLTTTTKKVKLNKTKKNNACEIFVGDILCSF